MKATTGTRTIKDAILLAENVRMFYRTYGAIQSIIQVFRKMGFRFFNQTVILALLDLNDFPDDYSKENGYSFHIATCNEISALRNYLNERYTKRQTINRIEMGHRLFVQKAEDKLVNFVWIAREGACLDWFHLPLNIPKEMVYEYGGYTVPEYRNRGIASRNKRDIYRFLKGEGVRYVLAALVPSNATARRIHGHLGFREYQILNYRRYWHIREYRASDARSENSKKYITLFRAPKNIWRVFCPR